MSLFHIHVDAAWITPAFEEYLASELGFRRTDFIALDGGEPEPKNHFTLKLDSPPDFRRAFDRVVTHATDLNGMLGYVEGEFIARDHDFSPKPFREDVPLPFMLELQQLAPGCFRESEIHIALCPERSDPRLLDNLKAMGFATIYIPKPWGISLIFTAQGTRPVMKFVSKAMFEYLEASGGIVQGSIKEERIAKWWMSSDEVKLPPVIHEVRSVPENMQGL
jgi:hypothetical protein